MPKLYYSQLRIPFIFITRKMTKKVLVAMSGGVDSSVAAFLLKKDFYVAGITMCLDSCQSEEMLRAGKQDVEDARRVCERLGITHYVVDFSPEFEKRVINNFISEYAKGRTPNPCIECNRFIKFNLLFAKARELGFEYLATGHYAGIKNIGGKTFLARAKDATKDQSYFLYSIKKSKLKRLVFPLFGLTKNEVIQIALREKLPIANKPSSQDICFIAGRDYRQFIARKGIFFKPGDIVDREGNIYGRHKGLAFYTIGQRGKLGVSGKKLYVLALDAKKNRVIVGSRKELEAQGFIAQKVNILVDKLPRNAFAQIRYRQKEAACKIFLQKKGVKVIFKEKQEAVTPGQSVVFYSQGIVLGGGIIEEVLL